MNVRRSLLVAFSAFAAFMLGVSTQGQGAPSGAAGSAGRGPVGPAPAVAAASPGRGSPGQRGYRHICQPGLDVRGRYFYSNFNPCGGPSPNSTYRPLTDEVSAILTSAPPADSQSSAPVSASSVSAGTSADAPAFTAANADPRPLGTEGTAGTASVDVGTAPSSPAATAAPAQTQARTTAQAQAPAGPDPAVVRANADLNTALARLRESLKGRADYAAAVAEKHAAADAVTSLRARGADSPDQITTAARRALEASQKVAAIEREAGAKDVEVAAARAGLAAAVSARTAAQAR